MRCFVVIPGALVPSALAADILREADAPVVRRLLRRAAPARDECVPEALGYAAHWHWLWRRFGGATALPVTAPYAWRALDPSGAIAAGERQSWHADPVHFAFARDHLLLHPLDDEASSDDELHSLAADAATAVEAAGGQLATIGARHGFIAFDPPWHLDTVPLDAALFRPVLETWPAGPDSARWRRLLTGVQITWHHHPVNARREASGRPEINGLWLHGGGVWAPLPRAPFATVLGDDPVLRGWMLAAGRQPSACLPAGAAPAPLGDAVTIYGGLLAAAAAQAWGLWLQRLQALDAELERLAARAFGAGFASIELVLTGAHRLRIATVTPSDRWCLWRNGPLVDWLAEPQAERAPGSGSRRVASPPLAARAPA